MTDPAHRMSQLITGAWISQMVYALAKLNIADKLAASPLSADQLADNTGMQTGPMRRFLRACESVDLLSRNDKSQYQLTELSDSLRSDHPGSQRALAIMMGEEHLRCWGDILHSLKTGETAFEHIYDQPIFEYLSEHPRLGKNIRCGNDQCSRPRIRSHG